MLHIPRFSAAGEVAFLALLLLAAVQACQLDQLVTPLPPAKLSVSPPALDDSSVVGSTDGVSRTLTIQPEGIEKVSWKASTAVKSPWLTLRTTSADAPGTLSLTLQPGTLGEGSYGDTVVVTPTGWEDRPVKIPVTFIVRAAPFRLAFTTQPASVRAGSIISPAVVVTVRDLSGKTITTWNGTVTISIATNPVGGILSGTLTATASSGVARFSNLSIDKVANGYTLRAAAGAVTTTSATFNVTPKSGSASTVASSAGNITASTGGSAATITVTARDDQGAVLPGLPVTVAATGTANTLTPAAGTTNAQGIFTSTLSSTRAEAKSISAMVDQVPVAQNATVNVSPGTATGLVFGVQPSNTRVNATITPAVTVIARDAFGNTAISFTAEINMEIGGNLLTDPKLEGERKIRAVNGVATFANLWVTRSGVGYTLIASTGGIPKSGSETFNVTPF